MSAEDSGLENTEPDNVNVGLIATITVVGALLVLAIALALTALVRSEQASFGTEIGSYANLGSVKRMKAEQAEKLAAPPSWADKDKGQVALPIDRAMVAVLSEIQKNPESATAAGAPAPSASAEPPPPAQEVVGKGAAATEKSAETRLPPSQKP